MTAALCVAVVCAGRAAALPGEWHSGASDFVAAPVVAQLTSPTIGSANVGFVGPFRWTPAPAVHQYYLAIGTSPGNGDVFGAFVSPPQTSLSVPGLPVGRQLWARIWTAVPEGGWLAGN